VSAYTKALEEITGEEMYSAIADLVSGMPADELLSIPGVWEVLSEHFNNEAIEAILIAKGVPEDDAEVQP
jgi:hypothetical protein